MDEVVKIWVEGRAGRIRLNRPKALHALDLEMVRLISAGIARHEADRAVQLILVDAPERGFCAGGDVRGLRAAGMAGEAHTIEGFFAAEYGMNQAIADCSKPFVSLIDGVCMGGGIGLSAHGSHRVASERALFAMPETAIALFPDVGTSYLLPRLPGFLGMYYGLTGARAAGADAVHAGFATHYVEAARFGELEAAIVADGVAVIPAFCGPLPGFSLAAERALIDRVFSASTVLEILTRLRAEPGAFAENTLAQLRAHSPSSIFWSFEILRRGAASTLPEALAAELALVRRVALHPEFHEGVRAVLVDKDRAPKWQPDALEAVDEAAIAGFFA
jgi:enoyl-CoA hydratase/carnithine racemase